jgi:nucleoside-diphosphate-sugar epimerase
LILGGAGFIGTTLAPFLKECGYDITVVDIGWFGNHLPKNIHFIKADIFDLKINDLKAFHTVIFLAGLSNDPMAEFSPKDNFIYNTGLPAYIGYLAKEAGVKRVIFASSCSVYGYTHNRTFTEDDIAISNYPYGVSKLQGEKALLALADENFSVICFRQGIESDLEFGQVINLSSFNTTIGDLAKQVKEFMLEFCELEINITDSHVEDYRNYKVSTEKAENLLGFKAVQDGLSIIDDLYKNLAHFSDFNDESFYNIEVFKNLMMTKPIGS